MEKVLRLYALPYDPKRPVICFDERPCFLIGDVVIPVPMRSGKPKREDYHYSKHGSCALFMAFEPHTGRRWAKVYDRRTTKEYSHFMQHLSEQFSDAEVIELVQDNLNTHQGGSFYAHLNPEEAFALAQRFEMHFTPKGASWLNMIEIEFSALSRQCLDRRIPCQRQLEREVLAWLDERNAKGITVTWQFSIQAARDKLERHYQKCRNP
jgi:hypothetical protein